MTPAPRLLDEIDRAAARAGTTRSAYLQAVAREALATPTHARIADALERGRRAFAGIQAFDYAAVAQARSATLATLDRALLGAGVGVRPSGIRK